MHTLYIKMSSRIDIYNSIYRYIDIRTNSTRVCYNFLNTIFGYAIFRIFYREEFRDGLTGVTPEILVRVFQRLRQDVGFFRRIVKRNNKNKNQNRACVEFFYTKTFFFSTSIEFDYTLLIGLACRRPKRV